VAVAFPGEGRFLGERNREHHATLTPGSGVCKGRRVGPSGAVARVGVVVSLVTHQASARDLRVLGMNRPGVHGDAGLAPAVGRTRGKSDEIDALAIARAALQEPSLDGPRPGEQVLHELKLLVDHRDDLVDERRRAQQRLRWHLHELDPNLAVPLGALDRAVWLDRLARQLARREQTIQVRISRELVGRCKTLTRSVLALDRELEQHAQTLAPRLLAIAGCGPLSAAKLLCEIGPIERFRSDAQLARHAGVAPLEASSGKSKRHRLDRGGNQQLNCALHRIAVTQGRWHPPARAYLERKQNEGKTRREALRCLKRQLARTVYTTLKNEPPLT